VSLLLQGYLVDNDFSPHANHSASPTYMLIRLLFYYCQVMSLNNCNDRRSNNGERAICSETQGVGSGLKRTQAIEMTILRHFKGFYLSVDCFQGSEIDIISIRLETAINFC